MPSAFVSRDNITGSFVSRSDPPEFPTPEDHPIHKVILGDVNARQLQLLATPKVEAILFVSNRKLVSMYLPRLTYDASTDPNEEFPIIAGALGSVCNTTIPASISSLDTFSDVLVLMPVRDDIIPFFSSGPTIPDEVFKTPENPDGALVRPPVGNSPLMLTRIPLALPKVRGEPVVEGPVVDDHVLSALLNYHPIAGFWLEIHSMLAEHQALVLHPSLASSLDDTLLPASPNNVQLLSSASLTSYALVDGANVPTSLRTTIDKAVASVMANNADVFRKEHPDMFANNRENIDLHQDISQPPSRPPVQTSPSDTLSFQGVSLSKKYQRPVHTFQLLLCTMQEDTITLPTLRPDFLACYTQASAQENAKYALMAMHEHDTERSSNTRDYLLRCTSKMPWNQATVTLWLQTMFHTTPFDDNKTSLKSKISFETFLPLPPESTSSELQKYLADNLTEQMQVIVGESNENKQKLRLTTFQGGIRNSIQDILTAIANLESRLSFLVDYTDDSVPKPLLVDWLLQLAHLYSSPEFKEFWSKYIGTHPWIPFTMSNQLQVLFALMTKTASNIKTLTLVRTKQDIPISLLQLPIKAFAQMVSDIQTVCAGTGPGSFATPPLNWKAPSATLPSKRKLSWESPSHTPSSHTSAPSKRPSATPADKGWIQASRKFLWPKTLSGKQLCTRFAQVGSSCPNGYNCPYAHKYWPRDFDTEDRAIIHNLIRTNDHISFAPGIRSESRDTNHNDSVLKPRQVSFSKKIDKTPRGTPTNKPSQSA